MIDPLAKAVQRERENREVNSPEQHSSFAYAFTCVVCHRQRPDEMRREPDSEVCLKCVEESGIND